MAASNVAAREIPKPADMEELVEEILARKGPAKYTDGLSEQGWEEELEKIPLFMTRSPDSVDPESAPAVAALQDIKYSEDTPEGRALLMKEDGNYQFKKKHYQVAVDAYSAGLREPLEDSELRATLFCNRAAAQFHLRNFRSSLSDAIEAEKLKPGYLKAIIRVVECCIKLNRFMQAMEWCDKGLMDFPNHGHLREMRRNASVSKKRHDRDERKQAAAERMREIADHKLLDAIKSRGIELVDIHPNEEGPPLEKALVGPHPSLPPVHLSPAGELVWPVLLLYPEFGQTDFIEAFNENSRFCDHLQIVFQTPPAWDQDNKYRPETVELYYECHSTNSLQQVNLQTTLNSVLASKSYSVVSGTPSFIVLSTASAFREHMLTQN